MTVLDVGSLVIGVIGVLWGINCYVHLWRWAKQCQRARIAVAFRQRVVLEAPLTDWLGWANQLDRDEGANGRVVYRNQKVSVAILRRGRPPSRLEFIRARFRRKSAVAPPRRAA